MIFSTIKEIKEELQNCKLKCKVMNHQKTLSVEGKENSFLIDKNENRFELTVFENVDYEIEANFKNISGFEVVKKIKNIIAL